jgi:hypothetical protein
MRNGKSAAVALLLMSSANSVSLKNKLQVHLRDSDAGESGVNPEFMSTMTLVDWKNFTPEETLDMYQKADYNVAKYQK